MIVPFYNRIREAKTASHIRSDCYLDKLIYFADFGAR